MGHWAEHTITVQEGGLYDYDCGGTLSGPQEFDSIVAELWQKLPIVGQYDIPKIFHSAKLSETVVFAFTIREGHEALACVLSRQLSRRFAETVVTHSIWEADSRHFMFMVWEDGTLLDGKADGIENNLVFNDPLSLLNVKL